ncbi:hypothetical protein J3R83DRAFT_10545 [Lanmaoa asiatica]|nr:hypothetical protein J3R83DRAFT_10545 [Lanmaoa asiatica]
MPTIVMLTGGEDLSSHQRAFFSPVLLARNVHKVLLGELFRKAVHRGADWDWKGAVVSTIKETQQEMIPEGVARISETLETWAGREGDSEGVLPIAAPRMRR